MLKDESKANSLKPNRLNVYLFTNNQQEEEKNAVPPSALTTTSK